ncbi:MAG: hypothetical protein DWQ01_17435 [Planctomycetota bacterium]|nr:MAG: hypothetical protein DWQ01_17435 [Planctomycetota bacterium]
MGVLVPQSPSAAPFMPTALQKFAGTTLALCLSLPTLCGQQTWYVDPAGNDRNGGQSPQDAFQSVSFAIQSATAGDTIRLLPGTHAPFTLDRDGLVIEGFPIATVNAGNSPHAVHLDASQSHFSGASVLQYLNLESAGSGSVGIRISGNGKVSAYLQNLSLDGFAKGIEFSAVGASPPEDGLGGQLGGGSWGSGQGATFVGKSRLRILQCTFLGGDSGGQDLPTTAIELNTGRFRSFEGKIAGCWIEGYPLGIDVWGATTISPRMENNDILQVEMGLRLAVGKGRGGLGFDYLNGIQPVDRLRIHDNRIQFSGDGGGGELPSHAISLTSAGQHEVGGSIRDNDAFGFTKGIYFLGGDGGGLDLPAPMSTLIQNNVFHSGGGGGGDLPPESIGIHLEADDSMPLLGSVENNDVEAFEVGTWVRGAFSATFFTNGNFYTDVVIEEVLEDTTP